MTIVNKKTFTVEKDGKQIELCAIRPSNVVQKQADLIRSKVWGECAANGVLVEVKLKDVIKNQGLWDDEKQKRLEEIDKRLNENEAKLPDANGKVKQKGVTLNDLRETAIQIRKDRAERILLLSELTRLRSNTAEGQAENAQFDYLVSQCIVYPDKRPYFASLEDYKNRSDNLDAIQAATALAELIYNHDRDFEKKLPENQLLLKYKMVREDDLALINKEGKPVDLEGNVLEEHTDDPSAEESDTQVETFDIESDDWAV